MKENSKKNNIGGARILFRIWEKPMLTLFAIGFVLAGCAGKGNPTNTEESAQPVKPASSDPVTVTLYAKTLLTDDDFVKYIQNPLKAKYPHITVKKVDAAAGRQPSDLIAAGDTPDFIWDGLTNIDVIKDVGWPSDLDPLVKKHKFDLNRLEPEMVSSIRSFSEKNELLFMPFRSFSFALHWNKTIFDKFGVSYPRNGMTWEETVELAKKVTRTENGVNYRGLSAGINVNRLQTQLSLPFIDGSTGKSVLLTNNQWQDVFRMFKSIYGIPGNYSPNAKFSDGRTAFLKDQNLAMFPHLVLIGDADFALAAKEGLEWGISTFPVWKEKPGIGPGIFSDGFVIPNGSKNPDLAFELIAYLLSDEVQTMAAKLGNPPALANPSVKKRLYEDNPLVKGIDLAPVLSLRSAPPYAKTAYDTKANRDIIEKKVELFYTDKTDLNTSLRQADEEINKMVETEKAKKK
ncbi:MAG: family 1 extracellular solute-binding protein [Paenibacillus sp.]|jgi:multiple sugar transport system substrate-binding protein|nr:family 1 extracellular solute-binding protein [Paenibacillus sp.]